MLAAFLAGELDFNQYDCGICPPELQRDRGCFEEAPAALFEFEDGTALSRCPVRCLTPAVSRVARAYRFREQGGILPVAGGWLDQSATLIDAFDLLDREIAGYDDKKR